jgi:hypothetical protein
MNVKQNSFTSNENKGLLWEMMMSNNMFAGIDGNNFETVKTMFENVIMRIGQTTLDETVMSRDRLLSLNKTAILEIRTNLEIFKKRNNEDTFNNEKAVVFDRNLESAKSDFMETIAIKRPAEPEFTDKMDSPIENMNELLERLEREREQLLPPQPSIQENGVKPKSLIIEDLDVNISQEDSQKKLTRIEDLFINNNINTNNTQDKRHVTFNDTMIQEMDNNNDDNYDNNDNNDNNVNNDKMSKILDILREIDRKQAEILILLKT